MRCECCNNVLSDKEATTRFVDEDKEAAPRYVGMCKKCQGFLPPSVRILTRHDLEKEDRDDEYVSDLFDYESEDDDGYEE